MNPNALSTRRRRTVFTLLAALVSAMLLLSAAPAGADIYEDNGGKPGTKDYSTNGSKIEGIVHYCDKEGNLVREGWGIVYNGPYAGCDNGSMGNITEFTNTFALCQPAMQVFRFYGTMRRPTAGWSTSMVAQSNWCSPKEARMWSTSRYDVMNTLNKQNFDKEELGGDAHPDLGHQPDHESLNSRGLSIHPMYALRWQMRNAENKLTSGRPFAGNNQCDTVQSGNPFQDALADPERSAESKKELLRTLLKSLRTERRWFQNNYGMPFPRAMLAAQKLTGIRSVNINRGTARFVEGDCATAMQYVTTADLDRLNLASQQNQFRVTGVCYIPVEHLARVVKTRNHGQQWIWPAIKNQKFGGGLRYSDFYKGKKHTAGHFANQVDDLPDRREKQILVAWRNKMADWYEGAAGPYIQSLTSNGSALQNQVIPAQPYATTDVRRRVPDMPKIDDQWYKKDQAKKALRNFSRCQFGPHIYFEDRVVEPEPVEAQANLSVENQAVHTAGGYGAEDQSFTVLDRGLTCDDSSRCVGRNITFEELTYNVTVTAPTGWKLTYGDEAGEDEVDAALWVSDGESAVRGANCSSNKCTIQVRALSSGSAVSVSARYFRPTEMDQKVEVRVSDVRARFSQIVESTTYQISTGPNGETIRTAVTSDTTEQVSLDNIQVTGTPVQLQGSPSAGWRYWMKVIGATSVR